MYHYLKHAYLVIGFIPATIMLVLIAPQFAFAAPLMICLYHLALDLGTQRDNSVPRYRATFFLDLMLYLHLPISIVCLASLVWLVSPGDPGGFGIWFSGVSGLEILRTKADLSAAQIVSAAYAVGFILSTNTLVAHELVHRTTDPIAVFIGRWLLGVVGDAQFSISHVYGHHVNIGTAQDPATARRGENVYAFALRSAIGQYREAWEMESRRLRHVGLIGRLLRNKVISGLAMTACFAAVFLWFGGLTGLGAYVFVMFIAKLLFEAVNYIEHYGIVRVSGTPVEPRHSWDCSNRAASNVLMNLSRHSHHHADARVKFWALKPIEGSLDLPFGYIGHIVLSFFPPLWQNFAAPRLKEWDETLASPAERKLAIDANEQSGHRLFAWAC